MTGMKTYEEILSEGRKILTEAGVPDADQDAWLLFSHRFGMGRSSYYAHCRETAEVEDGLAGREKEYFDMIRRRSKRIPLQHLTGYQEFMGYPFAVSGDVLIPRKETEILTETAADLIGGIMRDGGPETEIRLLDLCTGSGCIALSILNYTNDTKAVGTDISEAALKMAMKNASDLGKEDRTEFIKTDLFPEESMGKFDLIVSNPPYIASAVIETLAPEVKDYEPRLALDGDEDGLVFYRRIIDNAPKYLFSSGYLILEIGYDQAEAVKGLLEEKGHYHDIEVIQDYSGNDRVVRACYYA